MICAQSKVSAKVLRLDQGGGGKVTVGLQVRRGARD
jgi:hypothetical protein